MMIYYAHICKDLPSIRLMMIDTCKHFEYYIYTGMMIFCGRSMYVWTCTGQFIVLGFDSAYFCSSITSYREKNYYLLRGREIRPPSSGF